MKICPKCGKENNNNNNDSYCQSCGASLTNRKKTVLQKGTQWLIGLLGIGVIVGGGFLFVRDIAGNNLSNDTNVAEASNTATSSGVASTARENPQGSDPGPGDAPQDPSEVQGSTSNTSSTASAVRDEGFISSDGLLVYNGHHYYIYEDTEEGWSKAMKLCVERGGYLAVINDRFENEALFNYMVESGYDCAYFGITDKNEEGVWEYIAGDDSSFRDWGINSYGIKEPNNADGGESYAMLDTHMSFGHWNDAQFGGQIYTPDGEAYEHKSAYICEWDY